MSPPILPHMNKQSGFLPNTAGFGVSGIYGCPAKYRRRIFQVDHRRLDGVIGDGDFREQGNDVAHYLHKMTSPQPSGPHL